MYKLSATFLFCFVMLQSSGQHHNKISAYLQGQYNKTIYDITKGNNPWGVGAGVQLFYKNNSPFKPTVSLTADIYLADDKVFRTQADGSPIESVGSMVNLFAGAAYQLAGAMYISLQTGPSFISGKTFLGLNPSLGFYLLKNKRLTGKLSYINVFKRDIPSGMGFGTISLSAGVKLF